MAKMTDKAERRIKMLASEGKQISKIMYEDFPEYDYWDIYWTINLGGGHSTLGLKRTITNRLKSVKKSKHKAKREELIDETQELVTKLYEALKFSQKKLNDVRKTLDK